MELRTARRGINKGGQFRGCSRFPECRGTQDLSEDPTSSTSERNPESSPADGEATAQHYSILDVDPTASPEEIKHSYRTLVKVWHPDRHRHDPVVLAKAQEKLKTINLAYEKIKEGW